MSSPAVRTASATVPPCRGRDEGKFSDSLSLAVYSWLAGMLTSMFAGNSQLIGLPAAPQRVFFALSICFLTVDLVERDVRPTLESFRLRHGLMIVTVMWASGSALAAGTMWTGLGFYALLDRIYLPFFFFVVAPVLFRRREHRQMLLKCLILLGIYLGAMSLFQMTGLHQLVFPRYITDPTVGIHFDRARGPFLNAEANGLIMLMCAFAGGFGLMRLRGLWQATSVVAVALCTLGCLLTLTRSIWLGFVMAVLAAGLSNPATRRRLPLVFAVLAVALLATLAFVPALRVMVTDRAETSRSVQDRQNTNAAAVRIIQEKPLFGVGWAKFVDVGKDYVRQAPDIPITNVHIEVHNVILSRAAELGVPGAALWVGCVLLGPVAAAARRQRSDEPPERSGWNMLAIAMLVGWSVPVMSSPVSYPLANLMVWVLPGVLLAARADVGSAVTPAGPSR